MFIKTETQSNLSPSPGIGRFLATTLPQPFFKKLIVSEIDNLLHQKPVDEQIELFSNLQNLKAEWKSTLTDSQLANKLVEFDFIEQLIAEHVDPKSRPPYDSF